jgi:hypothetical protein
MRRRACVLGRRVPVGPYLVSLVSLLVGVTKPRCSNVSPI